MSDDIHGRLDEAGRRPAPEPDPAFADELEARLRSVAAGLPAAPLPPAGPPRRRGTGLAWRLAGLGTVAALVVAIAVVFTGPGSDPPPSGRPELAAPVNVEVALADGTTLEDPDGLLLPDGAVVRVGEGGSARIGEAVLGPGDVATIKGGEVVLEHPASIGVVPGSSAGSTTVPTPGPTSRPAGTQAPASTRPALPPAGGTPGPTSAPAQTPAPAPTPTRAPDPTRTPDAVAPAATATPTPSPEIRRPRLRARLVDGLADRLRIAVRWTATYGARSYVLLATASRQGPAADPVYPGSRVLGEFVTPPDRAVRYRVPDGVEEVRLLVVALRDDGRVLRRSRVVTIDVPSAGDTAGADGSASPSTTPTPSPEPTPSP